MRTPLMVLFVPALLAACASSTTSANTVSCTDTVTASTDAGSFATRECVEYADVTPSTQSTIAQACGSSSTDGGPMIAGAFTASPCDHAQSPGGCRSTTSAGTVTVWFYNPGDGSVFLTASGVQSACSSTHGTYVAP